LGFGLQRGVERVWRWQATSCLTNGASSAAEPSQFEPAEYQQVQHNQRRQGLSHMSTFLFAAKTDMKQLA
jgi:hypothetical protein